MQNLYIYIYCRRQRPGAYPSGHRGTQQCLLSIQQVRRWRCASVSFRPHHSRLQRRERNIRPDDLCRTDGCCARRQRGRARLHRRGSGRLPGAPVHRAVRIVPPDAGRVRQARFAGVHGEAGAVSGVVYYTGRTVAALVRTDVCRRRRCRPHKDQEYDKRCTEPEREIVDGWWNNEWTTMLILLYVMFAS